VRISRKLICVPTANYELIHLHGLIEIHTDVEWKRQAISDLTRQNEDSVSDPEKGERWEMSDAPDAFIDGQLKAVVVEGGHH